MPLSLPSDLPDSGLYSGIIEIEFPNYAPECGVANLLNVIAGEPHHLGMLTGVKLLDFSLSDSEMDKLFDGPRLGSTMIRRLLNVGYRPLLCAPIKPATGLLPEEFALLTYEAAMGGADVIKDDELYFELPYSPLARRAELAVSAIRRAEDETGDKKLYFVNICGDLLDLDRRIAIASDSGADGILLCPAIMGPSVIAYARERCDLIILAHNAMITTMTRVPDFGISLSLWSRLCRLSGADLIVMPTPYGTFGVSESEFIETFRAAVAPEAGPGAMPAFAGGKTLLSPAQFSTVLGSNDFAVVVGAALFEHPLGARAGAAAIREACEQAADSNRPSNAALDDAVRIATEVARSYREQ
jgi:ribulose 1,5-bisphosphate carboxylase large subunit-like protein